MCVLNGALTMHKSQAIQAFVEGYYGSRKELHKELRQDYLAVQFAWECFVDCLCKDREITMQQYESWTFPWAW